MSTEQLIALLINQRVQAIILSKRRRRRELRRGQPWIVSMFVTTLVLFGSAPALAQSGADWDMRRDNRANLKVAFTAFDNGLAIGVRCTDGVFEVAIAGLPLAPDNMDFRPLRIGLGGSEVFEERWFVASERGTAISSMPAPLARELRQGGRMDIVIPGAGEGGRNIRYVMDLPSSAMAIDETLGACGRTLEDPRDALLPELAADGSLMGRVWERAPRPQYPSTGAGFGFVTLSCIGTASGDLEQCLIEAEYPPRQGFGRAALRAAGQSRLKPSDDGEAGLIVFRSTFYLDGFQPDRRPHVPTGSRLGVPSPDG